MRPLPAAPEPTLSTKRAARWEETVEVQLITRLFGGGVRPREIDERSWLRPPALKSALRFWWRAGHAHQFDTLAALYEAESRLFGRAASFRHDGTIDGGPGLLEVEVSNAQRKSLEATPFVPGEGDAVNIAYWGAAPNDDRDAAVLGRPLPGARASILLRFESRAAEADRAQILEALRLWLVLGGVGARTRRGAGGIAISAKTAEAARALGMPATEAELKSFLLRFLRVTAAKPHLSGLWDLAHSRSLLLGKVCDSAEDAHKALLEALRDLRQDRPHPKGWVGPRPWGQSRWPEGDAIRHKNGGQFHHKPRPEHAERYPRTALGLPIVVHFKPYPFPGEPADHTITAALPGGHGWSRLNRVASPLILRVVRVWLSGQKADQQRFVPVAWLGPLTLPAKARPLVELPSESQSGRPVREADVVPGFEIVTEAELVFRRLEDVFQRNGFTRYSKETK